MKTQLVSLVVCGCAIFAEAGIQAAQPPRYKLEAGQELTYEGSSQFNYDGGSHRTAEDWKLWVTRQNADGSFHIVAQNDSYFAASRGTETVSARSGSKRTSFGSYDVFPDGTITNAPEDPQAGSLTMLFLKLPADTSSAHTGWVSTNGDNGKFLNVVDSDSKPEAGKWIFQSTEKGIFNDVYLSTRQSRIHLDGGNITRIEYTLSQGYGFKGTGTGVIELKSNKQRDAAWMTQLARETETFEHAMKATGDMREAIKKGTKPDEAMATAQKTLRDASATVKLPVLDAQFAEELKKVKDSANYLAEDAQRGDGVLNKPAASWSLAGLDGKQYTLADYRGKVVVLDFWYRGCGWCIRAMPQIKQVAEQFHDQPVAVLGMNTDHDEKDAQFVSDKLSLNYPTLKAEGIPEKYSVQGFPTLIIIDQKGIVRGRHVGYSPKLREEVGKTIEDLLASGG